MTSTTTTGAARRTRDGWSRGALWLGILAVVLYVVGFVAVSRIWPGEPLPIGIATTMQYVLPLAGLVVGSMARRREGARAMSTIGLALSTACLLGAVVPVIIGVIRLSL